MNKHTVCPRCDHRFEVAAEDAPSIEPRPHGKSADALATETAPAATAPTATVPGDVASAEAAPADKASRQFAAGPDAAGPDSAGPDAAPSSTGNRAGSPAPWPLVRGSEVALSEKVRRGQPRRTPRGLLLRAAVILLPLLSVVVAARLLSPPRVSRSPRHGETNAEASPQAAGRHERANTPAERLAAADGMSSEPLDDPARDNPAADNPARGNPALNGLPLDQLEQAIVKIESDGPGDLDSQGAGFVIDPRGLVATSYHVLSEHTQARVRFKNGATYDIAGYVALRPDADLAVVQLSQVTGQLPSVRLRHEDDPRRLASVVSLGHPHGLEFSAYDGKVSRVLRTSQLPGHSRRFLRERMRGSLDHRWIQHTARISGGNSGGPLFNEQGEVIGINTWVDRQTSFSYALHARHLHELLGEGLVEPMPLGNFARKEARVAAMLRQLSAEYVERLAERAAAIRWQPASDADYETLQQLAWAVTVAQLPGTLAEGEGIDPRRMNKLQDATDRVVQSLRGQAWGEPGQVTIVNEYAARNVSRPLAGLFFFGTVERLVEGDDGTRAALMRLAGTEHILFLPLEGQLIRPRPGTQYLVLGVNYDGHVVRYGDNPLRLISADVVATRTLLPLD